MNKKKIRILKVAKRDMFGKKVKRLRKAGFVPASVYGQGFESVSIQADTRELKRLFSELGESGLFSVQIDGGKLLPVLFKNPQYHPLTDELLHIDFYKVDLSKKISADVPIELVGEAPVVKLGNVLMHITNAVEIEGLPADLPERIEVDVSVLKDLENMITVADLKIDKKKVTVLTDLEQVVVKSEEPKEEEIEIVETAPEIEGKEPVEGEEAVDDKPTEKVDEDKEKTETGSKEKTEE